jgi:nicotinamidase-related amidase
MLKQWQNLLSISERELLANAKMGRRIGFGKMPALIIIDAQVYMVGDRPEPITESIKRYPSSCGEAGWQAMERIKLLTGIMREKNLPVIYTQMSMDKDGKDGGVYLKKRDLLAIDNWMITGTPGWQIAPSLAPEPQDIVIQKHKPSAFFGTMLNAFLNDRGVDTVIVTGGSVSNCVRATVFDAASLNYRVIVASDAVIDRIEISKQVNLFDMDRQWADVITTAEIVTQIQ